MQSATSGVSFSVIGMISHASPVVIFVLLLLIFASIVSWAIIFLKWKELNKLAAENKTFLKEFWNAKNLDEVEEKTEDFRLSPVASLFRSGLRELRKIPSSSQENREDWSVAMENVQRSLQKTSVEEVGNAEKNVPWLATIASAAPFVGLFGTVWGIMNSFHQIGVTGAASLAVVAPGISEALIATAVGLAAAIPAVVGYNFFTGQIRKLANELDGFSQDFLNLIRRNFLRHPE